MGVAPQVLEIIFEVQRKMNNEKITRREISFLIYKILLFFLFFFPSFWTPPTFKPHNFLISYSF
jgi:glycopeptide antibiotics resistance protein